MRTTDGFIPGVPGMVMIAMAYIICHGATIWVIAPVQHFFWESASVFASLAYLPHGVRVLSVWLMGWRAILPLVLGAVLANLIFTGADIRDLMQNRMWISILTSTLATYLAFELLRVFGVFAYAGSGRRMNWRQLLLAGLLASVFNSMGQTLVFSGIVDASSQIGEVAAYMVGDILGQVVLMMVLMLIFRALRSPIRRS